MMLQLLFKHRMPVFPLAMTYGFSVQLSRFRILEILISPMLLVSGRVRCCTSNKFSHSPYDPYCIRKGVRTFFKNPYKRNPYPIIINGILEPFTSQGVNRTIISSLNVISTVRGRSGGCILVPFFCIYLLFIVCYLCRNRYCLPDMNIFINAKQKQSQNGNLNCLALVIQKVDNAIHRIDHYPADKH